MAGEPSSIIQATGGDTLRRNFQQIQEGRVAAQNLELQQQAQAQMQQAPQPNRNQKQQQMPQQPIKQQLEEQSRPALPQRLIVVPDPQQSSAQPQQPLPMSHAANRPLPPTPRSSNGSSSSSSQAQAQQPPSSQRNSQQNMSRPMVEILWKGGGNVGSFLSFSSRSSRILLWHTWISSLMYIYIDLFLSFSYTTTNHQTTP